jgi:hypothetical protein
MGLIRYLTTFLTYTDTVKNAAKSKYENITGLANVSNVSKKIEFDDMLAFAKMRIY